MAKPSERDREYIRRAEALSWDDVQFLWEGIRQGNTPGWEGGKAFEHLIIRAFKLSQLEAEYPYDVPPGGKPIEQIDGLVHLACYTFLIECKDKDAVDIEAIAKLRNQLLRRPETTFGCVFTSGDFTDAALIIVDFAVPHRILLWSGLDVEECIKKRDFSAVLLGKYRHLCRYGLTDHSPNYKGLEL